MGGDRRGGVPRHRPRTARRGAWSVPLTLVTAAALLSACGGEATEALPAAPTATRASPSASEPAATPRPAQAPSHTEASPTPPPRPRSADTPKGREQFAELVVRRWGHALATNDATAVTALAPRGATCQGCAALRAELGRRAKQGWFVDFPGAEVKRVRVARGAEDGVWVATARIAVPASRSYFEDGGYRNDNEAHPDAAFTVRMRHAAGRFVLLGFSIG